MARIRKCVESCRKCGSEYGSSACGYGKEESPKIFFIGMNPWVKDHYFDMGKGITIFNRKLKEWRFEDFFMDNVVKCQMPWNGNPTSKERDNCMSYLDEQIELLNPELLVLFGKFASESFGLKFDPWSYTTIDGKDRSYTIIEEIDSLIVPHFSSILYGQSKGQIERYYRDLKVELGI